MAISADTQSIMKAGDDSWIYKDVSHFATNIRSFSKNETLDDHYYSVITNVVNCRTPSGAEWDGKYDGKYLDTIQVCWRK